MIARRRFLQVLAASAVAPLGLAPTPVEAAQWRGFAFGAEVSINLTGPGADQQLTALPALIERIEATFSLYRPSELTKLNADGAIVAPSNWLNDCLDVCDRLHDLTEGAFDPTVQPLWQALATGGDVAAARAAIGWGQVSRAAGVLRLGPGQALTLNGVAQGFAADLVRAWLARAGFTQALVNLGEYAALGGPYTLGIADVVAGQLGQARLASGRALAASSPRATLVSGQPHIQHPRGLSPLWSTVAVEADSAALADGLSTALVFADRAAIADRVARIEGVHQVTLIDDRGDLSVI